MRDRPELLRIRPARPSRLRAAGSWALRFGGPRQAKVVAVAAGSCWISAGGAAPVPLRAGEAYLLPGDGSYVTASDPRLTPGDGPATYTGARDGVAEYAVPGAAEATRLLGAQLLFDDPAAAGPLFRGLPPGTRLGAEVLPTLTLLAAEAQAPGASGAAIRAHVAAVLSLQLVRVIEVQPPGDPAIDAALSAIRLRPGEPWTVARLAAVAGLSRTVFAARFTAQVGVAPMAYLLRRRMRGAAGDLAAGRTVAATAARWGYASESAFSAAYKRVTGRTPGAR